MIALADKITPIYYVGIYARLSREDGDSAVSESINNQIEFLKRYIDEQPEWVLADVFVDDGYTGTNFNRPDFQRLLKAIESQQVNLVITKDLSRLGRDYIDTGHYVERYFPQQNVRYIALNDGVDTFEKHNSNNDMSPFKSVMNDFYARDISKKVRSAMHSKKKSGQYIGSFAPYGYLKSPLDKNKLIIDPQAAPVVKRIFEMYLAGSGYTHIAHMLNAEKIPSPCVYKAAQNAKYKNAKAIAGLWTAPTVKSLLINPTYKGDLTQNKFSIVSYKVKKLKATPKDSWLTVQHTHEPIIDGESFDTVQGIIQNKPSLIKTTTQRLHLFGGLLYCKDCGSRMTFTKTQKGTWFCICSNYKQFKRCTRHSYIEDELEQVVMNDLRRIAKEALDQEALLDEAQKEAGRKIQTAADRRAKEKGSIEKRLAEIKKIIRSLYEDKAKGILDERDYVEMSQSYHQERESLTARLTILNETQEYIQNSVDVFKEIVHNLVEFNKPTRLIMSKLINRVEVSEDKTIDIYYNFKSSS